MVVKTDIGGERIGVNCRDWYNTFKADEKISLKYLIVQALEKLSSEHAQACLRAGALLAVLSYLDFFQTSVQRVAVATAAHMCRGVTRDNTEAINSAVPILTNLLQYQVSVNQRRFKCLQFFFFFNSKV
jgi:hypothetical protein